VVDQLKTVYTSVKDVELYIAGTFCYLIGQSLEDTFLIKFMTEYLLCFQFVLDKKHAE